MTGPKYDIRKKGIAISILKESENAIDTYCCMHNLSLSISTSAKIQLIENVIEA